MQSPWTSSDTRPSWATSSSLALVTPTGFASKRFILGLFYRKVYMEALQNSEYCAYFDLVELGVVPASGATD